MRHEQWIAYLERVLATAQIGLTYSKDRYDIARFETLRKETASILASGANLEEGDVMDWLRLDKHYVTPKMDVRAIVLEGDDRVLFVREAQDGLWTLPGGWCDVGESAGDAVTRETEEETGLSVEAVRLLALFDKRKHPHPPQIPHAFKAFFWCRVVGGSLRAQTDETTDARYWSIEALPELSLHRVLPEQVRVLVDRLKRGERETLFD